MIVQVPRMAATALAHATRGVNAKLASLATAGYFGGDPTPPDVAVTEPSQDDFAALATSPADAVTGPVVSVMLAKVDNFAPHGYVMRRDAVLRLVVRYDDASQDDASTLYRNGAHTMRAILLALGDWLNDPDSTRRMLDGVHVITGRDVWISSPPELSQEATPVVFAAYVDLEVEDIAT